MATADHGLGGRMKLWYELRTRQLLPRRTYTIVRLDGKTFHTYTRDLDRPWDERLAVDLADAALFLCERVAGARLAYCQSDEVSLLLTDFDHPTTEPWFAGQVQKIVSVSASLLTARFNELRRDVSPDRLAFFDSRVFTIADPREVENYFIWRQRDATRNSIQMAAHAHMSHQDVLYQRTNELQELLFTRHGVNWNDYDPRFKRGTVVYPLLERGDVHYVDRRSGETRVAADVERRVWRVEAAPIFTQDPLFLAAHVPPYAPAFSD